MRHCSHLNNELRSIKIVLSKRINQNAIQTIKTKPQYTVQRHSVKTVDGTRTTLINHNTRGAFTVDAKQRS